MPRLRRTRKVSAYLLSSLLILQALISSYAFAEPRAGQTRSHANAIRPTSSTSSLLSGPVEGEADEETRRRAIEAIALILGGAMQKQAWALP